MTACVQHKERHVAISEVVVVASEIGWVVVGLSVVQAVGMGGVCKGGYICPFTLIVVDELDECRRLVNRYDYH